MYNVYSNIGKIILLKWQISIIFGTNENIIEGIIAMKHGIQNLHMSSKSISVQCLPENNTQPDIEIYSVLHNNML